MSKSIWQKAFDACEKALIAAVNRRDKVCQVASECAKIGGCDRVLQMDHGIISRKHKSTFFEARQMILLCKSAHTHKTFKNYGFDVLVASKIAEREGMSYIEWLQDESRKVKKWSVQELEEMTRNFNTDWRD